MQSVRPYAHITVAILIALVLIGGAWILVGDSAPGTKQLELAYNQSDGAGAETSAKDTDNDGLADWQERLWKTDPENPDSDGDGTSDGAEVAAGRDPSIAGPDDARGGSAASVAHSATGNDTDAGALTITEALSRDFISGYLSLSQGGAVSEDTQGAFVNTLIEKIDFDFLANTYTARDLNTVRTNNANALGTYRKALESALVPLLDIPAHELAIVERVLAEEAGAEKEFATLRDAYARTIQNLLAIPVPSAAVDVHLGIINATASFLVAIEALATGTIDPAYALGAAGIYEKAESQMFAAYEDAHTFLTTPS